ncbi:MAG: hypothetical protein ABIH50_04895 [bacterium]
MTKKVIEKDNVLFVPISKTMGKRIGFTAGSQVKVTEEGYRIIITPEHVKDEEEFTEEELAKIETLGKKNGGKTFDTWEKAEKYLKGLMR